MKLLLWHVHGTWTTSFVQGGHEYLLPVTADRGPDGLGRATSWDWPANAREVTPTELADEDVDAVVLQRPHELELTTRWLGRTPGADVPAVYVEHNTPKGPAVTMPHPMAGRDDIVIAHVTHFNALFWDNGRAPIEVVEHGIIDPGTRWTGDLPHIGVVVNEPVRRGRVVGADLLSAFSDVAPLDVYGMQLDGLHSTFGCDPARVRLHGDLRQDIMHAELARRRVYLHPYRWTSLGLSLIEAMHLGMPIVALGVTAAADAIPPEAGCVSTDVRRLQRKTHEFIHDHEAAEAAGMAARTAALGRFGLGRFLDDWDRLLKEVAR
jgi:hypothetical protein